MTTIEDSVAKSDKIRTEQIVRYWQAANYLAAAQIYLRENVLLREPLKPEHIKPRLLGHWGTVPGINLVYAHLNRLILAQDVSVLLVTGPGHGAPANLANLFLEGSLGERHEGYQRDGDGLRHLVRSFSWPGGFPSHLTPATPGTIHEGGELGYALATAFGAALDNPQLLVACIVGDGEAETGPTATAWHSIKFLNPHRDGSVLPILHLNQYKIASRTLYGAMSDSELESLFRGFGYHPLFVNINHDDSLVAAHQAMRDTLDTAFEQITAIRNASTPERPRWPMIILKSPKGWSVVDSLDGKPLEGSYRAHQVPIPDPQSNPEHLQTLQRWLRSYQPEDLFDESGCVRGDWIEVAPTGVSRMGMNPHAAGGQRRQPLQCPPWRDLAVDIDPKSRGQITASDTKTCGEFLKQVVQANRGRYRIVCPDEMDSNRLSAVFDATDRQFMWPVADHDEHVSTSGSVMEILSEHTCQGWLQGYLLTGRHGLFPCYEAFVSIVDSMMGQYAKFLKRSGEIEWRKPVSSLNYLLSSEGWRQDHNGYSHQMPGFINTLLNKKAENVRIYLPPDTNCLLSTMDHCLRSTDKINLIVASKQPMPQYLSADEAAKHCERGLSIWDWASNESRSPSDQPDAVLACAGVYPTAEAVMAARLLSRDLPSLRLRLVNVTDLLILELDSFHPHGLNEQKFVDYFGVDCPVIFNFHGYPSAYQTIALESAQHHRFRINGYREEGTTTTPLTLLAVTKSIDSVC
ncbi:xylulose-5-phosphate/fructose-6-phosphate phosphoketolase [Rhodopirellula maiorica SM1]|uniref:Xylulose-5-phosphate/fructose-6-phosphate phosphoketolase n=1 Tax=Rhodopirellula maiorica SM1 TaxID=1265738 RepID=M5RIG8_9BACT|nr:phosphoketolase family protein [Rhodopirellula maiorica]EMI18991.1 xylulose-5-phosphate/fructose-6-phosphate phosphoketolase [Rhodopirellula maiorica SM1]